MSPEGKIVSGSVYKIVCRTNGKVYIGESTNITMRTNAYSKGHCKGQVKLYNSIKKYGWNDHDFSILHVTGQGSMKDIKSELWAWEKYYICLNDSINNGLNCREGGIGVSVVDGDTRSRMSAARMSIAHLGKVPSAESRAKQAESMRASIARRKALGTYKNH